MSHWLWTWARTATDRVVLRAHPVTTGVPVLLGREGDVPVGVEIEDMGVSRRAVVVTATPTGWDLEIANRNGAVLHPWGQAPTPARPRETVHWPRVGLRIRGEDEATEHWVLLETASVELPAGGPIRGRAPATRTARSRPPDPLTRPQLDALETVFAEHLQWPPTRTAQALQLKQAATRLRLSEAGVKDRLINARRRSEQLGMPPTGSTTDPEYLYSLVRAGLIALPPRITHGSAAAPATVETAVQQSGNGATSPV